MRLIGGIRSHLGSSKFIISEPMFSHLSVWPMYALISPASARLSRPVPCLEATGTRDYMGQTEKSPNIGPITMNLDENKWDRIPPMSRTFLGGGSAGRRGPNWMIWGEGPHVHTSP